MEWVTNPEIWISLLTLTMLEIVLGIDNLVVISILSGRLPPRQQPTARFVGLSLALITRLALLGMIFWLTRLTTPLFHVFDHPFSGKDIIMLLGGLFLIGKSTHEIHGSLEGAHEEAPGVKGKVAFWSIISQIILLDVVFSLDSVITAVGMVDYIGVMVAAIIIAIIIMLIAVNPISRFVDRHPSIKMLALSFLILIGVMLVADGLGQHIDRGYIYFAFAFSLAVEMLNMRFRAKKG